MCGISSSSCDYDKTRNIPCFVTYIIVKKWNIFLSFFLYFFVREAVISVDEFYKLKA